MKKRDWMFCLHAAYMLVDGKDTKKVACVSDGAKGYGEKPSREEGSQPNESKSKGEGAFDRRLKVIREQTLQKGVVHTFQAETAA